MIEKTIRDLNYVDYRLIDYGTDNILIEYKGTSHWRVIKKDNSYILESLIDGINTINARQTKKKLSNKKILKWVLESIGVKKQEKENNDTTD